MERTYQKLVDAEVGQVLLKERLAAHTTMKIGGAAALFVEPTSLSNLKKVLTEIKKANLQWKIIGRGSNILVADEGYHGVIIKIDAAFNELKIDGTTVTVGAGHSLISLAMLVHRQGLTGLEFAAGIPGSVGGAIYMNAGAHGSNMAKVIKEVHIIDDKGETQSLTVDQLQFSYRTSIFQEKKQFIIIGAVLELAKGDREQSRQVMKANKQYRQQTQPWNLPCSGSVFRNPLPYYAGKLIEDAGLKGYSIGDAKISKVHSNFIVNKGNATATDVIQLIEHVKKQIKAKYGVSLQTEIEIIVQK